MNQESYRRMWDFYFEKYHYTSTKRSKLKRETEDQEMVQSLFLVSNLSANNDLKRLKCAKRKDVYLCRQSTERVSKKYFFVRSALRVEDNNFRKIAAFLHRQVSTLYQFTDL